VIAVSSIYYAALSFNLASPFHPKELLAAAKEFCEKPYSEVERSE